MTNLHYSAIRNLLKEETEANFKNLDTLLHYAKVHGVLMTQWLSLKGKRLRKSSQDLIPECGTVGCLLGTYYLVTGKREELFPNSFYSYSLNFVEEFGISYPELRWLFTLEIPRKMWNSSKRMKGSSIKTLQSITSEEAIKRLEKFILYKKRKAILFETWNNRLHHKGREIHFDTEILDAIIPEPHTPSFPKDHRNDPDNFNGTKT